MIYHPDDIDPSKLSDYDLCIIGSGIGGLTVCAEMLYSGLRICVIESGFFDSSYDASPLTENLRAVQTNGITVPNAKYERVVGGATKAWEGICAPMDPIDFEKRPFPYHDGWPITHIDLVPYLSIAAERYYFPPPESFQDETTHKPSWQNMGAKVCLQQTTPVRIGREFRYMFERKNVDLMLETTALALRSSGTGTGMRTVSSVECRTRNGKTVRITAKRFVLATGGIENPRILLNSKEDDAPTGLGNEHDQVGRYLMSPLQGDAGVLKFRHTRSDWKYFSAVPFRTFNTFTRLRISEQLQREKNVLNCSLEIVSVFPWQNRLTAHAGMLTGTILSYLRSAKRAVVQRTNTARILRDFPVFVLSACALIPYIFLLPWYVTQRMRYKMSPFIKKARVQCTLEMEPLPDNRVTLSNRLDAHGAPIPLVTHGASEHDIASAEMLLELFGKECSRLSLGDFVPGAKKLSEIVSGGAQQQLGTTRMGATPATSVVDADLRLHSVSNLYVTGTSVFPTGGSANPAMTVVALSIRLAEHLLKTPVHTEEQIPAHKKVSTAQEAIIIGSGRRITDDVVPAFEVSEDCYRISRIFARTRTTIFGRKRPYDVLPFTGITVADIAKVNLIYIAVPVKGISDILKSLTTHSCSHIDLVVDTPAVSSESMQECYKKFRSVHVAEDSVFLPWLDVVRPELNKNGLIGAIKKIIINRSAYRYHGIALVKALCGLSATKPEPFQIRAGIRFMHHSYLVCRNRIYTFITGPYLKKGGSLRLVGTNGSTSDKAEKDYSAIECLADESLCRGFKLGASTAELTIEESDLVGRWEPTSSILTHMQGFKRVGLSRLLRAVRHRKDTWRLGEGLNDVNITRLLERIGIFADFQ